METIGVVNPKKTLFGVVILVGMTTGRVVVSCPIKRKQYIIEA